MAKAFQCDNCGILVAGDPPIGREVNTRLALSTAKRPLLVLLRFTIPDHEGHFYELCRRCRVEVEEQFMAWLREVRSRP